MARVAAWCLCVFAGREADIRDRFLVSWLKFGSPFSHSDAPLNALGMSLAFDEYGRPFIIIKVRRRPVAAHPGSA